MYSSNSTRLPSTPSRNMPTATKAELAAAANLSCPLLSLSNEIIASIVYELHPREAIFLSLTCRALFHGVLSSQNYYLWYRVGRFSKQLPGHKAGWMLAKKVDKIRWDPASPQPPATSDAESALIAGAEKPMNLDKKKASPRNHDAAPISVDKDKGKACSKKKPTRRELLEAVKSYSPAEAVVDYKRLLVETMLGDTDTGCQWCLAKPMTRKIYESWNIRLCEGCFYNNVITKHACKLLNIDISHLPVQDVKRQGGVLHGVWKPSVQRLTNAKNGNGRQPVEEIIAENKGKKQAEKDTAAGALAAYRERHFVAIFESVKVQYREKYDQNAKTRFRESRFARLLEKVPPEQLKIEWFMQPRNSHAYPGWRWKAFCKDDPLMKELRNVKGGEKWGDVAWVEKCAREKIVNMETVFTRVSSPSLWDIPTVHMNNEITILVKQWHIQRARDGGVEELINKMTAANGGLQCPWTSCNSWHSAAIWGTPMINDFINHLQFQHKDILIFGDTDWLIGRPSRWWLGDAPHDGTQLQIGTRENEKPGKQEVHQAAWLRQWWPDRWKEENVQILEGWRDNGGFYGQNPLTYW
ncbi:hypothetical protein EV426DRAFT_628721 [Tirmania nivea]|nr:hypothetical protein EV426DRAFT_628721 [Tirmania nivea]